MVPHPERRVYVMCALLILFHEAGFSQVTYATLKGPDFNVRYQQGVSQEEAQQVLDYLKEDYTYLNATLGL